MNIYIFFVVETLFINDMRLDNVSIFEPLGSCFSLYIRNRWKFQ